MHAVEVSGLLDLLAKRLVAATGDNMTAAGGVILWVSAVLSALLDNIPFVATMIPLLKSAAPAYGGAHHIEPLWWCLALGVCLGGNGTLIGSAANLTVAGIAERNCHSLFVRALSGLRAADDAGVDRDLPALCLAAIFLKSICCLAGIACATVSSKMHFCFASTS